VTAAGELHPYVVLLRAVNLGPHKRIAMADLRGLLSDLGFSGVRTVLQSGNAVVLGPSEDPVAVARRVEQTIAGTLRLTAGCLVLTAEDVHRVVAGDPFGASADNGSRYQVFFLFDDPAPALRAVHDPVALDPDRVRVGERVVYQWCPDGILAAPPVGEFVAKNWKVRATARNWNTVTKLAALVAQSAG
jgi:uncharacterized protein (DUF1697 family)